MTDDRRPPGIDTVEALLAHALALELEAQTRYGELADQLAVHNNHPVARLFRRMAEIEGKHVARVKDIAAAPLPHPADDAFKWETPEAPETTPIGEGHYLMSPRQALELAWHNERRAAAFFEQVGARAQDPRVVELAEELAAEEHQHVAWVAQWLEAMPETALDWDDDWDPPNIVD